MLFLADVTRRDAEAIVDRLLGEFRASSGASRLPALSLGFYDVSAGTRELTVKPIQVTRLEAHPPSHRVVDLV